MRELLDILVSLPKVVEWIGELIKNPRRTLFNLLIAIVITAALMACLLLALPPIQSAISH